MTPTPRPDVGGIKAQARHEWTRRAYWNGTASLDKLVRNDIPALIAYIEALEARMVKLEAVVAEQAADEGLWFQAEYSTEAYFQQELRRLHEIIEGKTSRECALAALGDGDG